MKVPWTEHKTNEEIMQMVETEREIMDSVRSRQKRWLGHILRHDSLLRITLEGQIQGKKVEKTASTIIVVKFKLNQKNVSYNFQFSVNNSRNLPTKKNKNLLKLLILKVSDWKWQSPTLLNSRN